jgi:hypothetical protein
LDSVLIILVQGVGAWPTSNNAKPTQSFFNGDDPKAAQPRLFRSLDGRNASVTHTSTAMTEHKDDTEGWQTRLAVTIWYEL